MTVTDLPPVHVDHPAWCGGACQTRVCNGDVREVVHEAHLFEVGLQLERDAAARGVAAGRPLSPWRRNPIAVVTALRFDLWDSTGELTASDPAVITVDGPEGVLSLTADEAAQLGAALIRAARQLGQDGVR